MRIRGVPIVFNAQTLVGELYWEQIAPGAVDLAHGGVHGDGDIRLLWNHDHGRPLARTKGGTLRLTKTAKEVKAQADLPDTSDGRDVAELIRRGVLDGMSFGFVIDDYQQTGKAPDGRSVVTITALRLHEISVVTWPQYTQTSVEIDDPKAVHADAKRRFDLMAAQEREKVAARQRWLDAKKRQHQRLLDVGR